MAQNVTIMGASYPDVPQVVLPKTGGGTAAFTDVSDTTAGASDVADGAVFYSASGVRTVGTLDSGNFLLKTGDTATGRITFSKAINQILIGTGTAGQAGSATAAYIPTLWTFNAGFTPVAGDIITIKIPVAGVNAGVWLSVDNGTNYYPVALLTKTRFTTTYAVNVTISLVYETGMTTTIYGTTIDGAAAGATAADVVMDRWSVVNFANTTYSTMSQSEMDTGTVTSGRVIRSDYLKNGILKRIKDDRRHDYGICSTAAATAAKTVDITDYALVTGGLVTIKFGYAVPANATLNINSKGAKSIYFKGAAIKAGAILAGDRATFVYNNQYHLLSIDRMSDMDAVVDAIIDTIYPVGTIYTSLNSSAPTFGGTWREVILTYTNDGLKTGEQGYKAGTSSGPVHHWQRVS